MQGSDCMKGCLEYDHCDVSIVLGPADPLGHDSWALVVVFHYLCSAAMLPSPSHHSPWLAWTLYTLETESIFCRAFKYLCLRSPKKFQWRNYHWMCFPWQRILGQLSREKNLRKHTVVKTLQYLPVIDCFRLCFVCNCRGSKHRFPIPLHVVYVTPLLTASKIIQLKFIFQKKH